MHFKYGTLIQVDHTRCLNYQHHGVQCGHCISQCPGEALYIEGYKIKIDRDHCLGCGLCFADCPTEVFKAKGWDETEVVKEVRKQGKEVTKFYCGNHEKPYLKMDEKDKGAVQLITCLGSLSKVAWYEIGLQTNVELHLEKCSQCSMKSCVERIQLAVTTGEEWLRSSGYDPQFSVIHDSDIEDVKKRKRYKAISSGLEVTSRRDLFLSIIGRSKEKVQYILEKDSLCSNSSYTKKKENYLPNWHRRLVRSYVLNTREDRIAAYWPSIEKQSSCIHCGICSRNCPTQTLRTSLHNNKVITTFTSGTCIDCRICMLFCPVESIIRDRRPNVNPFKQEVLQEMRVSHCTRCESLVVENEQSGLCYWCKNEAVEDDLVNDVWNNLIDNKF
jgi:ferredoxin